jgi:hypothetical protein
MIWLLTKYDSGDQMEKTEIDGACSPYGEEERCIEGFCGENLRERDHLKDPSLAGRIILECTFRKKAGSIDCTDLFQYRNRSQGLANAVMNLRVP